MRLFTTLSVMTFIITFLISVPYYAQDLNERIENIKGEVNKIIIATEDGEYTFEGEDADKLLKKMRSQANSFVWHSEEKDGKKKIVFLDSDSDEYHVEVFGGDEDEVIIISEDIDAEMEGMHKKIKVEVEEGNKKVTVTTKKNGEEKTEVYEGEEADKYIEEMNEKHGGDMDIFLEKDPDGKVKKKKIIIEKESEEITE